MTDSNCSRRQVEAATEERTTGDVTGAVRLRQLLYQQLVPAAAAGGSGGGGGGHRQGPLAAVALTMKADHPDSGRAQPLPPYWLQSAVNNIPWPFIPTQVCF